VWNARSSRTPATRRNRLPDGGETVSFAVAELAEMLKAIEAIDDGAKKQPRFQSQAGALKFELGPEVRASLDVPGTGKLEEHLSASSWSGKPTQIAFNPRFLADLLRVFPDQKVISGRISSPIKPALFEGDNQRLALLMPIRAN
jgi:DNA polymerase III sliding clamp (beta) subunit (PCNA family)